MESPLKKNSKNKYKPSAHEVLLFAKPQNVMCQLQKKSAEIERLEIKLNEMEYIIGLMCIVYLITQRMFTLPNEVKEKYHFWMCEIFSYFYIVGYFVYEFFSTYELIRVQQ